jgi:hypothetical protein
LIAFDIRVVLGGLLVAGTDRVKCRVGRDIIPGDMNERRVCRLSISVRGAPKRAVMGGAFPQSQAPLAPDDAGQLLDEVFFGRSLRPVVCFRSRSMFPLPISRQ